MFIICIAECVCVCVCVCVCDVKKLYSNRQRSLDALSRPRGGREKESERGREVDLFFQVCCLFGLICGGRCTLRKEVCVFMCVCVCVCVCLVFGSSCKSELASTRLMYNSKDAEGRSTHTHTVVCPWLDYFVGVVVRYRFFFFLANSELPDFLVKVPGVNEFQDYFKGSWCSFSGVREH